MYQPFVFIILATYQKKNIKVKDCYLLLAFFPVCASLQILCFTMLYFHDPKAPIYFNSLIDHNDVRITVLLLVVELMPQFYFWAAGIFYIANSFILFDATRFWIKQIT